MDVKQVQFFRFQMIGDGMPYNAQIEAETKQEAIEKLRKHFQALLAELDKEENGMKSKSAN